ncbi:F-type H+-transporting ATPase subunit epsilon [Dysgonomonas sp. PH5-45]|uniref:ATP synthase F1 subunit epsilon n=1 Tax=unclassified Dysgonomonas TaxID=2630389 RepID=UPI002473D4D5|nr:MULTISPECIES: ATP synthase F1 subunit epsilon [unclassified Dysgonomonas]MDH6354089.1 F-type H+-transporting ATPase subunit epsilon [Dysgonomonas sp. PH5-45]MDH6387060.1 F-type H+-transporting ATPase subunit epsilon [Dysgonomonas sp. PH5-37]
MKDLDLKIISAEKSLYQGKATFVKLPGTEGNFSVHHNHAPLISSLQAGEIVYGKSVDTTETVTISGGFVEVKQNVITVCVEQ